jgi:hypothetical protein
MASNAITSAIPHIRGFIDMEAAVASTRVALATGSNHQGLLRAVRHETRIEELRALIEASRCGQPWTGRASEIPIRPFAT